MSESGDTIGIDHRNVDRIRVGIADHAVTTGEAVLATSGLGSCVGVGLYDPSTGVAGLLHVMLPSADDIENPKTDKYADTGIEALLESMEASGASRARIEAKIAGGSSMIGLSTTSEEIGQRNVQAVRSTLDRHDIEIVGEDVGGNRGRSLEFETMTGELICRSAHRESRRL